jgi:hypothetical protein
LPTDFAVRGDNGLLNPFDEARDFGNVIRTAEEKIASLAQRAKELGGKAKDGPSARSNANPLLA